MMAFALCRVHETLATSISLKTKTCISTLAALSALPLLAHSRIWGKSIRRNSLDTLPADIQLEIFKYLEWWDILCVRQVCRSLYHTSKTRHLWLNAFYRYSGQELPYTLFLNKKLDAHSASELEDVVLGPHKADVAWMRYPPRIRKTSIRSGDKPHSLLPGGRWALATTRNAVVCYDLVDPEPTPVTLVSNPIQLLRRGQAFLSHIATDVDTSTPYLTLNLAVLFSRYNERMASRCSVTVQVWRLSSRFDTAGQVVGLEPQLLSTFDDNHGTGRIGSQILIRGRHVAYALTGHLHVVDWTKLNNQSSPFNKHLVDFEIRYPYILLSNGRILESELLAITLHGVSTSTFPPGVHTKPAPVLWRRKDSSYIREGAFGPLPNSDHTADQFLLLSDASVSMLTPCAIFPNISLTSMEWGSYDTLAYVPVGSGSPPLSCSGVCGFRTLGDAARPTS